jgi:hypothetical protein
MARSFALPAAVLALFFAPLPGRADGDAPGAQKWGETFHVSGYPTVVILRLETLDAHLRTWNKEQHASGEVQALRARRSTICAKLPAEDTGQAACRKFLAPKA